MRLSHPIGVVALALILGACATTSVSLQGDGGPCEASSDCSQGLVCKAARCGPAKSRLGDVCVTDRGCESGLSCLSGRCTTGPADADTLAKACDRLTALYRAQLTAATAGSGQAGDAAAIEASAIAFSAECIDKLKRSKASKEQARCIADAKSVDAASACP